MSFKKLKGILTMLVCIAMVLGMIAGCQQSSVEPSATTDSTQKETQTTTAMTETTQEPEKPYFPLEEQIEITFMSPDFGRTFNERVDQVLLEKNECKN